MKNQFNTNYIYIGINTTSENPIKVIELIEKIENDWKSEYWCENIIGNDYLIISYSDLFKHYKYISDNFKNFYEFEYNRLKNKDQFSENSFKSTERNISSIKKAENIKNHFYCSLDDSIGALNYNKKYKKVEEIENYRDLNLEFEEINNIYIGLRRGFFSDNKKLEKGVIEFLRKKRKIQ